MLCSVVWARAKLDDFLACWDIFPGNLNENIVWHIIVPSECRAAVVAARGGSSATGGYGPI